MIHPPFCKAERDNITDGERVEEIMRRVEGNDAGAMCVLGTDYYHGQLGLQQDRARAMELWTQAAKLDSSQAQYHLGVYYDDRGELKKAKFHYEAAAMVGDEVARSELGALAYNSGNMRRAVKHWTIAASGGIHYAMQNLLVLFKQDLVSRDEIESAVTSYNNSCRDEERSQRWIHW